MTEKEFISFAIQWVALNKHYQLYFPKNSLMFPEPFLIDFLIDKYNGKYNKNSSVGKKRSTYDLTDSCGLKVEVKSSFHFGSCHFSKNQNACDRIIYVNFEKDKFEFYEIDNADVQTINQKNNNGFECNFRQFTKGKGVNPFLIVRIP